MNPYAPDPATLLAFYGPTILAVLIGAVAIIGLFWFINDIANRVDAKHRRPSEPAEPPTPIDLNR